MEITVTTDELYEICNALNSVAADLERDAKRSNAKGHTLRQIGVVEESARQLRALSKRLIDEKNAADLDDWNYVGSRHHY